LIEVNSKMNYLIYSLLAIIFLPLVFLLAAALTGHDQRAYNVLAPNDMVEIGGDQRSVAKLATKYQPYMNLRASTPSPNLLWVWYEAVPTEHSIDMIYYHVWENEINPNPNIHTLYSLFRAAYYGYPLYDIEYLQVSISRLNGDVDGLLFETSPQDSYFITLSEHIVDRYILKDDDIYDRVQTTRTGEKPIPASNVSVPFNGEHVLVLAQTWNHLTRLLSPADSDAVWLDAQLKPLSAEEYAHFKFVRKSQGDHRTHEKRWTLALATLAMYFLIIIPSGVILKLKGHSTRSVAEEQT
jgi:hypothetical protein